MSTLPKIVHLEPTDACNLSCPLCAREIDQEFDKNCVHHLTVEKIQSIISDSTIKQLDKMYMCGNYGDPAAGKYTIDIFQYFRSLNPTIVLGMNSNGALKSAAWWENLAGILNQPKDYVVFSIDGLEDTNSIYRVNSSWSTLLRNARSFINAGGSAHWDMLIYKHNEHQVEQAKNLAKDLRFKWFRAKVSKRPLVNNLEYPINWQPKVQLSNRIDCHVLKENSIYIDAQGRKSPCCWLGARQSNFISDIDEVKVTWNTDNPDPTCLETCALVDNTTNFENQWRIEVEL